MFPTDLTAFIDIIRQHGDAAYSLMFAYATTNSLLLGLFAGYAAHAGALDFTKLVLVCWSGSLLGDAVRFWVGRKFGTSFFAGFPRIGKALRIVAHLSERHHVLMILAHRYPHGIRGIAGFAYGMSALPWSRFLILNFIAAGLWACAIVSAGYAFGQLSEKAMQSTSSSLGAAMLILFLGMSWVLGKRLEQEIEKV